MFIRRTDKYYFPRVLENNLFCCFISTGNKIKGSMSECKYSSQRSKRRNMHRSIIALHNNVIPTIIICSNVRLTSGYVTYVTSLIGIYIYKKHKLAFSFFACLVWTLLLHVHLCTNRVFVDFTLNEKKSNLALQIIFKYHLSIIWYVTPICRIHFRSS